jgi:recombination protein RecR
LEEASAFARLVNEFSRLPGIGRKTAERLAYHLLKEDEGLARRLTRAILEVRERVRFCSTCGNMTEEDPCAICRNEARNHRLICAVEEPRDVWAIEKTGSFRGVYHVLMGSLSPLDGVGPDQLRVRELLDRIHKEGAEEVIVATDPDVEGDATALYLSKLLKPLNVSVTRIASGLPSGGDLEYADSITLSRALTGRQPL